jgi:hypothetical protein
MEIEGQHSLFFFILDDKLKYDAKNGYRTAKIPITTRLFEEFVTTNSSDVEMGGFEPPCKQVFKLHLRHVDYLFVFGNGTSE